MTEHLGYPPGQAPPGGTGNVRNGSTTKTVQTELGSVEIKTPRDRDASFDPKLVAKRQTRLAGLDEKILGLYAGGMSVRDIQRHLTGLYGVEIGRDTISRITDAVLDDVAAWRARPLEEVYPVLFLDALVVKVRENGAVRRKACYLALGMNCDGEREVLGLWWQDTEGAKFWLQVLTDLKQRGVADVLVYCVDGLKGFPEAIESVFPQAWVQTCIVHLIRHSLRFVARREREKVAKALRPVYTAPGRRRRGGAREPRCRVGATLSEHHAGLALGVGAGDPVPGVPARRAPRALHDEHHRSAQPTDPQGDQDARALPRLATPTTITRPHPQKVGQPPRYGTLARMSPTARWAVGVFRPLGRVRP